MINIQNIRAGMTSDQLQPEQKYIDRLGKILHSNGRLGNGLLVTMSDLMKQDVKLSQQLYGSNSDFASQPLLVPRVVLQPRTAQQQVNNLTSLMTEMPVSPVESMVISPALSVQGGAAFIAPGEETPEIGFEQGANGNLLTMKKAAVGTAMTMEEMEQEQSVGLFNYRIGLCRPSMDNLKESFIADFLTTHSTAIIDNSDPAIKSSTGRDILGQPNGTFTLEDLYWCLSTMINDYGVQPDTLVVNPMTWKIWTLNESFMRHYATINGQAQTLFREPVGDRGQPTQWAQNGSLLSLQSPTDRSQLATMVLNLPLFGQLTLIPSPFMAWDATTARTDMLLVDSTKAGMLLMGEELTFEEFAQPQRDMFKFKFRERYNCATMLDGAGVARINSIFIDKSYMLDEHVRYNIDLTGISNLTGQFAGSV